MSFRIATVSTFVFQNMGKPEGDQRLISYIGWLDNILRGLRLLHMKIDRYSAPDIFSGRKDRVLRALEALNVQVHIEIGWYDSWISPHVLLVCQSRRQQQ